MRSHSYQFGWSDVVRLLGPTLAVVVMGSIGLHVGASSGWLPRPRPAVDIDRTILVHQTESAREQEQASIVLIGDSSCLMNVVATQLAEILGKPVRNLATLSYVDLPTHGRLIQFHARANPDALKTVVLLMHPESLRLGSVPAYFREQIIAFAEQRDISTRSPWSQPLARLLGVDRARDRVLSRVMPWPLPGEYGRFYGFTRDLERFMDQEGGSAMDPNTYDPEQTHGLPEWRLATRFENECQRFRGSLPKGTRLIAGLTPSPESYAATEREDVRREILSQWTLWLGAEKTLERLPLSLPDNQFASTVHLNSVGRQAYTRIVAEALANAVADGP